MSVLPKATWKDKPFIVIAVNTVSGRVVEIAILRIQVGRSLDTYHTIVCSDFPELFPGLMEKMDAPVWVGHHTKAALEALRAERLRITEYPTEHMVPQPAAVCDVAALDALMFPTTGDRGLSGLAARWRVTDLVQAFEAGAINDAMATALVFRNMWEKLPDRFGELARMQQRAAKAMERR